MLGVQDCTEEPGPESISVFGLCKFSTVRGQPVLVTLSVQQYMATTLVFTGP